MRSPSQPAHRHAINLAISLLVALALVACSRKEAPAPASDLTPPSPVAVPLTLVPQPASTPIPDLQVPIVAPILPEAVGTPVTTPVPVPPIEVQSPLLEAPDLTSNIFVEYILDASGSMMGQLADHTRKRDVAQKVFISRLGSFPPQIHIGFRAFGHSMDWRGREDASCQDIELIAPVQTGQLETIAAWLSAFTAQGMTPLAQAIRYAVEDLPKADGVNNALVLISDGEETCGGDPCAVVNQLRAAGVHFTLHVVGMNVRPEDAEQLLCVARAGQGFYKPVQTAQELNRALEEIERHIAAGNAPVVAQLPTPAPTPIPPTATPVPPTLTPTPSMGIGSTMISAIDGMELVYVPAGEFTMGSSDDMGRVYERPLHAVYLDAYWIDRTEVTNTMYEKCVSAAVCPVLTSVPVYADAEVYETLASPSHPVVWVPWSAARTYCQWAGRRLPSEAEWEKAARGIDGRTYPWGSVLDSTKANFGDEHWLDDYASDGYPHTAPVGSFAAGVSPYGALDMLGNAEEWVADWWDGDYYASSPYLNPVGPPSGSSHVRRGGSFVSMHTWISVAWRHPVEGAVSASEFFSDDSGFRCAVTP